MTLFDFMAEGNEFIHKVGYLLHLEQNPYEDY